MPDPLNTRIAEIVTAEIVWENHHGETQVNFSTGHKLHVGGAPDGFCYGHQSFDCALTDAERDAWDAALAPEQTEGAA